MDPAQEKSQSGETAPDEIQMLDLLDRDFKSDILNTFKT